MSGMHNPGAMKDPQERGRVAEWIASLKGDRTGDQFAADIAATTGWAVDRTQASRYAKGSIPIGRGTVDRFSEYARAKGLPPLDLTPPQPVLSIEERTVRALEKSAEMAERQAVAWETIAKAFEPGQPTNPFGEAIYGIIREWTEQAQAQHRLPADRGT